MNPNSMFEGINKNNFFGTYLIGPLLILNPQFVKKLLNKLEIFNTNLAFEEEVLNAYEQRLNEFKNL